MPLANWNTDLSPWYMIIDSSHFMNFKIICDNLDAIIGYDTKFVTYKFDVEKFHVFEKFVKIKMIKMIQLNITLTAKLSEG